MLEKTSKMTATIKPLFNLPEGIYLLNHSVGAQPATVPQALHAFLSSWHQQGAKAWKSWLNHLDEFCSALAEILGTDARLICPQANVTQALANILSSLQSKRRKIVLSELDFPSLGYLLQQLDFDLHWIKKDEFLDINAWQQAIDDNTLAVLVTHVISFNSYRAPVTEIIKHAQALQAISIIDVAQAVGVVPINVEHWQADFVIGTCAKWLCGGPGAGWLWMNHKGLNQFYPKNIGWFAHEDPFEMDIYRFKHAPFAARFLGGTPPIMPYLAAKEGIKLISKIGVGNIFEHNQTLTTHMINALEKQGKKILTPSNTAQRGGTICIEVNNADQLSKALIAQQIYFDVRKNSIIRLSPHIYNDIEDINVTLNTLLKF